MGKTEGRRRGQDVLDILVVLDRLRLVPLLPHGDGGDHFEEV